MEGKWTRPATEAGQEFGVNNRELYKQQEKSPKQRQVISVALICHLFVKQWGSSLHFSKFNVTWEYRLGKK